MKILQIFGAVIAVHFLAFIFIFASPGCQSGPRNIPTPDATAPVAPSAAQPVDLGTSLAAPLTFSPALSAGHAAPTRPGSPAAAALAPVSSSAEVAPVSTYTVVKGDSWSKIAPLQRPRGAAAAVVLTGQIHVLGGASAPTEERASVGWHEVYDPKSDQWARKKALPGARDHVGCVAYNGRIHIIGGRFNTFEYNTDLHHVYVPDKDTWELLAPLPTARSGHGLVVHRGRFYAMGGEGGIINRPGQQTVFGQMESYDPATNTWQSHAPMPTPRHAVGAVSIGDWIYVAGGGAVLGGGVQSAVHEAFAL
jgi:hypothetical protein